MIVITITSSYVSDCIPSLSMIVTVDDEILRDNDKQFGNNLVVILNVSLSSRVTSSMMSISNDEDVSPAEIVTLNTEAVTL